MLADLNQRRANDDIIAEDFARHSAGGHTRGRLAGRAAPAAAIIAHAIFGVISHISVTRPPAVTNFAVIFTALIFIFNHQADRMPRCHRTACTFVFKDAGQDFNGVGLFALSDIFRCARLTFVQKFLNIFRRQR